MTERHRQTDGIISFFFFLHTFFLYMNYSWDTIRDQVRDFRTNLQAIYPLQILSTVKEFTIDASNQLYFLSDHLALANEISPSRNLQLYHVDLNKSNIALQV